MSYKHITTNHAETKYKINTTSTTATGITPITGVHKHLSEPVIYFTRETWIKQCHLIDKCTQEVGWFAMVEHDAVNNSFTITELVIPKQEVTASETNIDKEDMANTAIALIEQGKDTSKMYAWFHSHVNMAVSPSTQDEYQIEKYLEDLIDQPEIPAFIRGIQNKKGELKLDVYYIQHGIAYQNVKSYVLYDDDPQWKTDIDAEILAKVTKKQYTYYNTKGSFGGGYQKMGKGQNKSLSRNGSVDRLFDDYGGYGGYGGYGNDYNYGFRRNTASEDWDTYLNHYPDEDIDEKTKQPKSITDNLHLPLPVHFSAAEKAKMEVVYQETSSFIEVMSDTHGGLWVCDADGAMYDYNAFTEAYGEID